MLVQLRRTWFGPNGARYRQVNGGTNIPNQLKDKLPKDAVILEDIDGKPPKAKKGEEPVALSELASTMNPPIDPDLQKVTEGEAVSKGNKVEQAKKT